MIVGVTMDVVASMVECSLVMIGTIQVSHGDGFLATALYFLLFLFDL